MASNPIWSEFLDGCRVLSVMVGGSPDPGKQAAREEARKTVRLTLKMKLGESGFHFSEGAADEMISAVARSYVQASDGTRIAPEMIADQALGLP
jgi:hypothetical protein